MLDRFLIIDIIKNALLEDVNYCDLSSSLIDENLEGQAIITVKEDGIIAGLDVAKEVYNYIDDKIEFKALKNDGEKVLKGEDIAIISGKLINILKGERVSLNFLQRMSGIATKAGVYADKVTGYNVKIVDTRKTTPGLRILEKYSVKVGGCYNHRYNLSDGLMIKDNHIKALGSITNAIEKASVSIPHTAKIEVETTNLDEVKEAIDAKVDIIMLDNMSVYEMNEAVNLVNKRAILEASGNMTLERIEEVAKTGVDIISVGELTHSVKSLDISLNIRS